MSSLPPPWLFRLSWLLLVVLVVVLVVLVALVVAVVVAVVPVVLAVPPAWFAGCPPSRAAVGRPTPWVSPWLAATPPDSGRRPLAGRRSGRVADRRPSPRSSSRSTDRRSRSGIVGRAERVHHRRPAARSRAVGPAWVAVRGGSSSVGGDRRWRRRCSGVGGRRRPGRGVAAAGASAAAGPDGVVDRHAGGLQDAIDHVGFFGSGVGLHRQCLGDGVELISLLALQHRALELLFGSHRLPRFKCPRWQVD